MIQNVNLVSQWNIGRFQLSNRAHNGAIRHVASGIVFRADYEDSMMRSVRRLHNVVQLCKVVVVACQEYETVSCSVFEMTGIGSSSGFRPE